MPYLEDENGIGIGRVLEAGLTCNRTNEYDNSMHEKPALDAQFDPIPG